ncbi:MAG TPA: ABC transporter substrate-binding protein [Euzebyales bacterium]|nr:ABC transporter substrate-binding protein [Euzebyales bacterium]
MHRWLVGWAVVALLLAACDAAEVAAPGATAGTVVPRASSSVAPARGGTLRWAIRRPAAIVPGETTDDAGLLVVDTLFDSLTRVDTAGEVHAAAAVRWRSSAGGRRWRFTLRSDARYHDGTAVRARDFAVSWAHTVELGLTGSHLQDVVGYGAVREGRADRLAGVRAVDGVTLEVRLRHPMMDLPALVAHPTLAPLPPRATSARRFADQPVGNGPYRITERWSGGQFIRVERDRGWRNGPKERSSARVGEIVFRIIDTDAAYVAFQQGRVDVAPLPAGARRQALRTYGPADQGRGPGVVDAPSPTLYFLAFHMDTPPWDDVEVRRALSRAIDRVALVDAQRDLELDPARWIVPPALQHVTPEVCDSCLHLPSLAADAFRRADVTEVTLTVDAEGGHEQVARRIRADLAEVGVDVTVETLPFEAYLAGIEAGELGLYRFGWQAQYPSPGAMLEAVVRSGAPRERGDGANYGGYADERVDRLLDRARRARSARRRQQLWTRAEERALRDQAIVPLFSFRQRTVISERVRDLAVTPWGTATPERARLVADPEIDA